MTLASKFRLFPLVALLVGLPPSPALAAFVTLSGTVTDSNNVGIFGVTINLVDSCTGQTAGVSNNVTSSTGTFTLTTLPGTYDVEFSPAAGSLITAKRIRDYALTTSQNLGQVILPPGVAVSGQITDGSGLPLSSVYLHFFPPGSTERVYTVHDRTDAAGNYSVVVSPGTYDLRYGPPSGTPYLTHVVPSVSIPGTITLPIVTLDSGFAISGTVLDSVGAGNPVINVNIKAVNAATGSEVALSHDRSDATGLYDVEVPAGTFFIEYEPQKCTLLAVARSTATVVSADTTMPTVHLPAGILVKGFVTDSNGAPVVDVNTDYFTPSGVEVLTAFDHTDSTGAFSTVIVPGTYSITYSPPRGLRLAGVEQYNLALTANPTIVPTVKLPAGFFVSGRVVTAGGAPVPGVDISFFIAGTSTQVYVSHHVTDATGGFSIVSVPGTYDILFTPPASTGLSSAWSRSVVVSADMTLSDTVLAALPPTMTSIAPNSGSTAGGEAVTVSGSNFQPGATLSFGGVSATVTSVTDTSLAATTPAHPAGSTAVTITNPGGQAASMAGAYTFQEPATPISLTVTRSGNDIVLTWTSTGQTTYSVFGSGTPTGWTDASVLIQTSVTTYLVTGGVLGSGIEFFSVE